MVCAIQFLFQNKCVEPYLAIAVFNRDYALKRRHEALRYDKIAFWASRCAGGVFLISAQHRYGEIKKRSRAVVFAVAQGWNRFPIAQSGFNSPQLLDHIKHVLAQLEIIASRDTSALPTGEAYLWDTKATEKEIKHKPIKP